jgi:hypothetical protein
MQRGGHRIARNFPDEYTALVSTLVYTLLAYRRKLLVLQILPVPLQLGSGCPEHSPARASRSPFSLSILSRFDCPLKPSLPAATASKVCASPHSIRAGFSAAPRRASASPSSFDPDTQRIPVNTELKDFPGRSDRRAQRPGVRQRARVSTRVVFKIGGQIVSSATCGIRSKNASGPGVPAIASTRSAIQRPTCSQTPHSA